MWLKLGDTEVINLDFISSIRKNSAGNTIEITYHDFNHVKSLPFGDAETRDKAYKAILENLSRMRLFFE
ncbi:hypothetical protein EHO61_06150 [Leptospira fluminis]|uniref:Uncharacterized protein n=1 Tax=Leptospira fluminis TaxID=2484979 RepID=A0A4R9GSG8_9LEPT|nr:hypothetical protein [Leptospira fluminis]TGK20086.1 hypothetical protein EHO61_06150 [Leptospira fluminis]